MRAGTGESASYLRRLTKTDHMSMAKNTNVDIQLEDESEEEIVRKTQNFFTGEKISLGAVNIFFVLAMDTELIFYLKFEMTLGLIGSC